MKDGKPLFEEAPGANVLVARTERGEAQAIRSVAAQTIVIPVIRFCSPACYLK